MGINAYNCYADVTCSNNRLCIEGFVTTVRHRYGKCRGKINGI